jgi:hypothetical protein
MQMRERDRNHYPMTADDFKGIKELLQMQSKGKFLTKGEKERVKKYAENKRKEKSNKSK